MSLIPPIRTIASTSVGWRPTSASPPTPRSISCARASATFRAAAAEAPRRTRNAAAELRALRAEKAAALRVTGTDDTKANIIPVRTGFEGVSIPDRRPSRPDYEPAEPQELEYLFEDEEPAEADDDGADLEVLLDDESTTDGGDDEREDIEILLDDDSATDGDDDGLEALL